MPSPEHIELLLRGVEVWNLQRSPGFTPYLSNLNFREIFLSESQLPENSLVQLSGINFRGADLEGANLDGVDLNGADLRNSNLKSASLNNSNLQAAKLDYACLSNATMYRSNLDGASLVNADLDGAGLNGSSLANAKLIGIFLRNAQLDGTNLEGADLRNSSLQSAFLLNASLTNANLLGSDLSNAKLIGAKVDGANFFRCNLKGTDLSNTRFWTSTLVQEEISPNQVNVVATSVSEIGSLLSVIERIKEHHPKESLYFRGQSNCLWDLRPSVTRDDMANFEGAMLTDLLARRPEDFNDTTSSLAQWVLAQHHGLKTRFLDVTKNPLVALFHSSKEIPGINGLVHIFVVPSTMIRSFNSDAISIIANFAKLTSDEQEVLLTKRPNEEELYDPESYALAMRHLIHFIRQEKPYFEELIDLADLFRVFVVEPQLSSERIRAHSGAFLASGLHQRFEREQVFSWTKQFSVYAHYKAIVPHYRKTDLLDQLKLLNITSEALFPGLDESARAITQTYRQRLREAESTSSDPE